MVAVAVVIEVDVDAVVETSSLLRERYFLVDVNDDDDSIMTVVYVDSNVTFIL